MSITHPCFQARVSRWIKDEHGQPMFFAVDHYFDRLAWEEHMAAEFTSRCFGGIGRWKTIWRLHSPQG